MTTNHNCPNSRAVQRHPLTSTTPPHPLPPLPVVSYSDCRATTHVQIPAEIWEAGALQPSKGLNLLQNCHRLEDSTHHPLWVSPLGWGYNPTSGTIPQQRPPLISPLSQLSPIPSSDKPLCPLQPQGSHPPQQGWDRTHPSSGAAFSPQPSLPKAPLPLQREHNTHLQLPTPLTGPPN